MIHTKMAVDHVGITVPDLDQAVAFFVDVLGFDLVLEGGPYDDFGYVWPGHDQSEKATLRLATLSHGNTHNVELLEYTARKGNVPSTAPEPADPGGMHLAFYVEDIEAASAALAARDDVRVIAPVQREEGGSLDGLLWGYVLTSFGLVVEIIHWRPGQLPYEAKTSNRLVPPPWLR